MTPEQKQIEEYKELLPKYLKEAEDIFGPKTDYEFAGLSFHNYGPQTILHDNTFLTGTPTFIIKLYGQAALNDRKDGIFQLSHEVVHLLSPVEQVDDSEVNYLEEGMATYFSKVVTERETGDLEFFDLAVAEESEYRKAYELYLSLVATDKNAVKNLRMTNPIIGKIKASDFVRAGLKISDELISALLTKF